MFRIFLVLVEGAKLKRCQLSKSYCKLALNCWYVFINLNLKDDHDSHHCQHSNNVMLWKSLYITANKAMGDAFEEL